MTRSKAKLSMSLHSKKVIFFWSWLIILLVFGPLCFKAYLNLKNSRFNRLSRVTFAIQSRNGLEVVSFENQNGIIIDLPQEPKINPEQFKKLIYVRYSLPVFGYVLDNDSDLTVRNKKRALKKILIKAIFKKTKTDLNRYDLLVLFLKSFKINKFDADAIKKDQLTLEKFAKNGAFPLQDSVLRKEALSLAVLNATNESGLAQKTANFLEVSGARVIQVADSADEEKKCKIFFAKRKESYTLFWLRSVYLCSVSEIDQENSRADITLILGEEYRAD